MLLNKMSMSCLFLPHAPHEDTSSQDCLASCYELCGLWAAVDLPYILETNPRQFLPIS